MLAAGQTYPYTCNPDDIYEAMEKDRESFFFIDVQLRGEYPGYAKRFFKGVTAIFTLTEIMKEMER